VKQREKRTIKFVSERATNITLRRIDLEACPNFAGTWRTCGWPICGNARKGFIVISKA
jgi:hypothetical protein